MGSDTTYQVEIMIEAVDRLQLLQDVSSTLAEAGVNILSAIVSTSRDGIATMRFLFELGNMEQLQSSFCLTSRSLEGVFEALRMAPGESGGRRTSGR